MTTKGDLTDFMFLATPYPATEFLFLYVYSQQWYTPAGFAEPDHCFRQWSNDCAQKGGDGQWTDVRHESSDQYCSTDQKLDEISHHYASRKLK